MEKGSQTSLLRFLSKRLLQWIEISQSALSHNIAAITSLCPDSQLGVVVKANAYGHGIEVISKLVAEYPHVSWLCTAGIEEALLLRSYGVTKRILAMSYTCDGKAQDAVRHSIDVVIDDTANVGEFAFHARQFSTVARVHVKVDVGLSRRGIAPDRVIAFSKMLYSMPSIEYAGICTHLSDNVGKNPEDMQEELGVFERCLKELQDNGILVPHVHALASAGITAHLRLQREIKGSLIRIGSYAYGLLKSSDAHGIALKSLSLRQVLSWKSRVTDLISKKDQLLALIPVSSASGYPYSLIGKASVEVGGNKAPLVGSLAKSFLVADVTRFPNVKPDDIVTLIGTTPGIDVYAVALMAQKRVNELLAGIDRTIPRLLVD